jgi:hypothetical protein
MGSLKDLFVASEMFGRLEHRAVTMASAIEHIERVHQKGFGGNASGLNKIVETGTSRIEGNWAGDGQSTLVWDWVASYLDISVTSIDLNPEYVEIAKKQTSTRIEYICADSVESLSKMANIESIGLLYLDSFDWAPEINLVSAFHHLAELATVWAKLPSGCLVMIDDCHEEFQGKHVMVYLFMKKLGIEPAFTGYQAGWIKP